MFDWAMLFGRLEPRRELVVAATIPAERDPQGIYITQEQKNTRSVAPRPTVTDNGCWSSPGNSSHRERAR
jgi:hypothetical protein